MAKSKRRPDDKSRSAVHQIWNSHGHAVYHLIVAAGQEAPQVRLDDRHDILFIPIAQAAHERGDEDIALPDRQLAASLGLPVRPEVQKGGDRNALTVFGRLGKFFWQQMTRIH